MLHLSLREIPRVILFGQVRQREGWYPQARKQPHDMIIFVQNLVNQKTIRYLEQMKDYIVII